MRLLKLTLCGFLSTVFLLSCANDYKDREEENAEWTSKFYSKEGIHHFCKIFSVENMAKNIAYAYGVRVGTNMAHEIGHLIPGAITYGHIPKLHIGTPRDGQKPYIDSRIFSINSLRSSAGAAVEYDKTKMKIAFSRRPIITSAGAAFSLIAGPTVGALASYYAYNKMKEIEKQDENSNLLYAKYAAGMSLLNNVVNFIPMQTNSSYKGNPISTDGYNVLKLIKNLRIRVP